MFKEFQRKVEAIGRIRHPNIVVLRAYHWSFEEKLLIYDYIPDVNLTTAIYGETEAYHPLTIKSLLPIMDVSDNDIADSKDYMLAQDDTKSIELFSNMLSNGYYRYLYIYFYQYFHIFGTNVIKKFLFARL